MSFDNNIVNHVSKQSVQYRTLDDRQCEVIVRSAFRILERTGCLMHNEDARDLMLAAGCRVEGERVWIPTPIVEKAISTAPSTVTFYSRDGEPAMILEPYRSYFGPGPTLTFINDVETGEKRPVTKNDAINAALVCEALPNIDWTAALAMISDVDSRLCDIHEVHAMLPNTKKPILTWAYNRESCEEIIEMFAAVAGGMDQLRQKPNVMILTCPADPLVHHKDAVDQILYLAEQRLPVMYIPGISMGSAGPVTIAGALAVGLANTLVGLVVSQLKNEGAPFIVAKYTDNLNMAKVSMTHSRPEFVVNQAATADIFRYLKLPFTVNLGESDSPVFDQQAAFDISMQLYTGALAGANMNLFIGYLESANTCSLESLVFGNEAVSYIRELIGGFEISVDTLAEDVIDSVGPGGNFLGEEHTFKHFRNQWKPSILASQSRDEWEANGGKDLGYRLNESVKEILKQGSQCPLPDDVMTQLDRILEKAEKRVGLK